MILKCFILKTNKQTYKKAHQNQPFCHRFYQAFYVILSLPDSTFITLTIWCSAKASHIKKTKSSYERWNAGWILYKKSSLHNYSPFVCISTLTLCPSTKNVDFSIIVCKKEFKELQKDSSKIFVCGHGHHSQHNLKCLPQSIGLKWNHPIALIRPQNAFAV